MQTTLVLFTMNCILYAVIAMRFPKCLIARCSCLRTKTLDDENIQTNTSNYSNPIIARNKLRPSPLLLLDRERRKSSFMGSAIGIFSGYSCIDCMVQSNNLSMSQSEWKQYLTDQFSKRMNEMIFEMQTKTETDLTPKTFQNSSLLILNGRHTIFDSISCNPFTIRLLMQQNKKFESFDTTKLLFFESNNYENTINIIRPGIIKFIEKLLQISGIHKLYVIVYVNNCDITIKEKNELISIITFIEMYYNYNLGNDENNSFKIDLVLIDQDHDSKTFGFLLNRIPLKYYKKLIVIDHEGLSSWDFKPWDNERARKQYSKQFNQLKNQFLPIQPSSFEFSEDDTINELEQKWSDNFFKRLLGLMSKSMNQIIERYPNADFATNWIRFKESNIIRLASDIFGTLASDTYNTSNMSVTSLPSSGKEMKFIVDHYYIEECGNSNQDVNIPDSPEKLNAKWANKKTAFA